MAESNSSSDTLIIPAKPIPSTPIRFFNITWALVCITVIAVVAWKNICVTWSYRNVPAIRFISCLILVYGYGVVFAETVIKIGLRTNISLSECESLNGATMVLYLLFELSIYYYFVEKIYQIQLNAGRRLFSWYYLLNFIIVLGTYLGLIVLQFLTHKSVIGNNECRLIRERYSVILLLGFSIVALVYLTGAFLFPIWRAQASNDLGQSSTVRRLRKIATRALCGSAVVLVAISVNRILHVRFNGFPIWLTIDTDMTVVTIIGLTLTWMSFEDTQRGSTSTASGRRSTMRFFRNRLNDVDWMSPQLRDVEEDGATHRSPSMASTAVTVEALGKQIGSPPKNGISVEIEQTMHYELAGQSSSSANKKRSRCKGSKAISSAVKAQPLPTELSFITSALDEVEEEANDEMDVTEVKPSSTKVLPDEVEKAEDLQQKEVSDGKKHSNEEHGSDRKDHYKISKN